MLKYTQVDAPCAIPYHSEYCQINESTHDVIPQQCQTQHYPKPSH